jgi:hypothetical protein
LAGQTAHGRNGGPIVPIRDVLTHPPAPPRKAVHVLTRIDTVATMALAVIAGVVAASTAGAPTGLGIWDACLKFLVTAVCVLAARRTPWTFVGLAGVVCAVASYGSPDALVAMLAVAVALFGWQRTASDAPASADRAEEDAGGERTADADRYPWLVVLRSACNGVIVCLTLRATWPHIALVPSLLGGVVVVALILPALLRAPRGRRRLILRIVGLAALAAFVLTAIAGVAVEEAKQPLQIGLDAARSGLHAAEHGDQGATAADFQRALNAFNAANSDLAWARAAEIVPVVSQQVRAVSIAADIGRSLSSAGVSTAASANAGVLTLHGGTFPVDKLAALVPVFQQDLSTLTAVLDESGPLSNPWVIGLLKSRFATEKARIKSAQHDAAIGLLAAQTMPGFLGAQGVKTDLVLVENPAESRASSGAIGDYAEVTADAGKLKLVHVGSVVDLNTKGVPQLQRKLPPISDFIDRYSAFFPQDHWENLNMSPDFPTIGRVASALFPQSGGTTVTGGVIGIDPVGLSCLLKLIGGSIPWAGHNDITQYNVVPFLEHYEFADFNHRNAARIKFVQGLLKQIWHRLLQGSLPSPSKIAEDMRPAIKGGHLEMYSPNAQVERFFEMIHIAGQMPPVGPGDFLGVATSNGAGNKIDWYLHRKIYYDAHVDLRTGTINATLDLTLTNDAPSSGQPAIVIKGVPGSGSYPGESLLWLSVYTPWILDSATEGGRAVAFASQEELARHVYTDLVKIPPGGTVHLVLQLSGQWKGGNHYVLSLFHQAVDQPDVFSSKGTVTP